MSAEENIKFKSAQPYAKLTKDCFKGLTVPAWHFSLGVYEISCNLYSEALEDFKISEEYKLNNKEQAVLCFYIGNCYNLLGYPINAAKYFKMAIDKNIEYNFIYILAARAFVAGGQFDEAMGIYSKLNEYTYDYIYTDMGMCCFKAEKYDEAQMWFEKSVNEGRNYAFALGGCSLIALVRKNIEESKKLFSKALINNIDDVKGFKQYYCEVAEAVGCIELIDKNMKTNSEDENKSDSK